VARRDGATSKNGDMEGKKVGENGALDKKKGSPEPAGETPNINIFWQSISSRDPRHRADLGRLRGGQGRILFVRGRSTKKCSTPRRGCSRTRNGDRQGKASREGKTGNLATGRGGTATHSCKSSTTIKKKNGGPTIRKPAAGQGGKMSHRGVKRRREKGKETQR